MTGASDDWGVWLDQHGPALVLLARQWVASHADAEDVVQEAFVRFWRSRQRAMDPAAYLYACVKRTALDWQRGRRRRLKREEHVARPEGETWFTGPLEKEERRGQIAAALGSLPQEQREVLVMKIWGGLSFPEIGLALSIPANTAASRYRYALAKLRVQLAEESIHE
jgi:RNA polymerase sigma-70 factor (ECF subfamily)